MLARLPEASDFKIAGQMIGVRTLGISENRVENLRRMVESPVAWAGVNEIEGGQPTQEKLMPIQIGGKPRSAMMGRIAVDKSGQCRSCCASISGGDEEGESVLKKAVQGRIRSSALSVCPGKRLAEMSSCSWKNLNFSA